MLLANRAHAKLLILQLIWLCRLQVLRITFGIENGQAEGLANLLHQSPKIDGISRHQRCLGR